MRPLLLLIACSLVPLTAAAIEPLVGPGNTGKKDGKEISGAGAGPHRTFSERANSGKVGRDRENEGVPVTGPDVEKAAAEKKKADTGKSAITEPARRNDQR